MSGPQPVDSGTSYLKTQVVNNLFFVFPRAANFLCPGFVTAPTIEIIGDRGVTIADSLGILWYPLFKAGR